MRRNGQIFKFWADREFVPLFGAGACSSYSFSNFGKKEQDTVSNFSSLPGATFAIDIGFGRTIYNEETKICGHRWGSKTNTPVLHVKTRKICRGAGCLSIIFVNRSTGGHLKVRKAPGFSGAKVRISAFVHRGEV